MHDSHSPPVPRDDAALRSALDAALDRARPRVRYADAVYERVFKAEVNLLESGEVLLKPGSLQGAMQLRLVDHEGRHLAAKAGTTAPDALSAVVDRALAMLALESPDPTYGLCSVPNRERERYGVAAIPDPRDTDASVLMKALVEGVRSIAAERSSGGVTVVPEVWAWWQVEEKWIADTEGMRKSQTMPVVFLQASFRARRGEKASRTRVRFGSPGGIDVFVGDDGALVPRVARELREECGRAVGLLDARSLRGEELASLTHYVLHKSALVFIHEGMGHPIEADIARAGGSAIVKPDGVPAVDPLGSAVVRIVDGPGVNPLAGDLWSGGFGTEYIDDEGVEVSPTVLVDGGRIVGMMHSRETAHAFGKTPTGNGFSELGDRRIVRMRNTVLVPEEGAHWVDDLSELVRGVSFGVVLHGSLGGAVGRDGMASSTQYGFLVRDGRVTDEMIVAGNFSARTTDCLRAVEGYAGSVDSHGVGFCGKSGQMRRVSEGGPEYVKLAVTPAVRLTFEET